VAAQSLDSAVLAAATAVLLGDKIFGKPATPQQALSMLQELAGQTHCVMTAVVVLGAVPGPGTAEAERPRYACIEKAQVTMVAAETSELDWYVSSGEPMDKAGSYALQAMGAALVESVVGDPTTVIGLPLRSSIRLLRLAGVRWP